MSPFGQLDVAGVRVRHFTAGAGRPLLFLHGWGANIESFSRLLAEFTPTRTVHALDFPGFGQSSPPPAAWGVAEFAALTLTVMDKLGVESPDIVAHSFGGRVTIKIAAEHPGVLGKLVLVGTPGIRRRRAPRDYGKLALAKTARWAATYCGAPGERLRKSVYGLIASPDYAGAGPLRGTFVRVVNEDLRPYLHRIRSETLLVWGENDIEVPVTVARAMEAVIPNARLVVIPRAGHFCYLDEHDYFRLLVGKFIR